eukprot:365334-Chlamydomonas_euryale.AAC.17
MGRVRREESGGMESQGLRQCNTQRGWNEIRDPYQLFPPPLAPMMRALHAPTVPAGKRCQPGGPAACRGAPDPAARAP